MKTTFMKRRFLRQIAPVLLAGLALAPTVEAEDVFEKEKLFEKERLFKEPAPRSLSPGRLKENPEVFLYEESLLMQDKGGYSEPFYTGEDYNRFSLGAHVSSNYQDPGELLSLEILFSRRLKTYTDFWVSFMAKRTQSKYDAIAGTNPPASNAASREGSDQSFTAVGAGGGYRFKALSNALDTDRVFETVDAFLTYNAHLDGAEDVSYQGLGLQTDYGLHLRAEESFYYGAKVSYNIATVKRAAQEGESLSERSLVFGWLSLGFELGYFY